MDIMDSNQHEDESRPAEENGSVQSIELVDIKTEPPDINIENNPTEIRLTIESVESTSSSLDVPVCFKIGTPATSTEGDAMELSTRETIDIKQETDGDMFSPEVSISYDIPSVDNSNEMSRNEDVRSSLQEEIVLKEEIEDPIYETDNAKEDNIDDCDIKTENLTEQQAAIDQHNAEPVKLEELGFEPVTKLSSPNKMTQLHVADSDFQLNSITGNMLSLEQEAYGLLRAKNETVVSKKEYSCSKCCKTYRDKYVLNKHLRVHEGIERRKIGMASALAKRRKIGLEKRNRDINLMDIGTAKDIPYHSYRDGSEPAKGQFECEKCNKQYRVMKCLRRHQRSCLVEENEPIRIIGQRLRNEITASPVKNKKKLNLKRLKNINDQKEKVLKGERKSIEKKEVDSKPRDAKLNEKKEMNFKRSERQLNEKNVEVLKGRVRRLNEKIKEVGKGRERRIIKKQDEILKGRKNGEYTCECGKTFNRRSPLETCLRSHHPEEDCEIFTCPTCAKCFNNKSELVRHRKLQHVKKKFICKFCPMDYHTQKELFDHLRVHKKVQMMEYKVITEVVEGKQVLKCFICNKSFTELSELKGHVLIDHKEPYNCQHCKNNYPKIVDFATHTKSAHPEIEGQSVLDVLEAFSILAQAWKCEECSVQFEDPDKLVMHQREQHSPVKKVAEEDSSKFLFRCEDCRRTFITLKQLSSHRDAHHTIKDPSGEKSEEASPEPSRPPLPMCVHCRKVCHDEAALTAHLRLHSMERKYPCKFCDFRFITVEKRKNHATIHTGDMKYVCFICEYRCTSENRLMLHKITQKHLDKKETLLNGPPYERRITPPPTPVVKKKRYSSERKKSESSDEQTPCDICGEVFPSQKTMLEHKETHPFIVFPNEDEPKRIFFK